MNLKKMVYAGVILSMISFLQSYAQVPGRPQITQQPLSDTLAAGGTARFTVVATGTGLTYQWQKNNVNISGALQSSYSISTVTQSDTGSYRVIVSNFIGRDTSQNARLVIATPPVIVIQPKDTSVIAGRSITFGVTASGSAPLSYQWQKNNVNINGATSSVLMLNPAQAGDTGSYRVIVSNSWGSAISDHANLTVFLPPKITVQPRDTTVREGQTVTFSAAVSGTAPLTYRWQKNGTTIANARTLTYTIISVVLADSGSYRLIVSNAYGNDTSSYAVLKTLPQNISATSPPEILTQPRDTTVALGGTATFYVVALSNSAVTYQWMKNGTRINSAQGSTYSISNIILQDAGQYSVTVTNPYGRVTSTSAVLTVGSAPLITQQPASASVVEGGGIGFSVTATGTAPLSYQWRKNGASIGGATSQTYSISATAIADSGLYNVVVSNAFGSVASTGAHLTVTPNLLKPSITANPSSKTVYVGDTVTFTVTATGAAPLSYQWRKYGVNIPNAQLSSLTISGASFGDSGVYSVAVSNSAGTVVSDNAVLQVLPKSGGQTKPVILQYPSSQTVLSGNSVLFSVSAAGARPLSYQWQKNNVNITGATDSFLSISAVALSDSGMYRVIVSNSLGADTSPNSALKVTAAGNPPVILTHPSAQNVYAGDTVTFSVNASGTAPLSYQWQKNGVNISNAQFSSLRINGVSFADSGIYRVIVTNNFGSVSSNGAVLAVAPKPTIGVMPKVTKSPASQTVVAGGQATFNVIASGTPPIYYQWQKNSVNIANALAASYTIAPAALADSGSYRVIVFNSFGSDTSAAAVFTVLQSIAGQAPVILKHPSSQAAQVGDTVSFAVSSAGATPLSFQWQKNSVNLTGANDSILTLKGIVFGDSGVYRVIVSNAVGIALSNDAHLSVSQPVAPTGTKPVIRENPSSQTAVVGSPVTFSVVAGGTAPLSYQWQKNGAVVAGATGTTYTIPSVALSDSGSYRVTVTNTVGSETSFEALLVVVSAPAIRSQPATQTAIIGTPVTFSVTATGTAPLSYQWQKNNIDISGATGPGYTIASAGTADSGTYRVIVKNSWGTATSNGAVLTVSPSSIIGKTPVITRQPVSQMVQAGDSAFFSVVAASTEALSYQWQKNLADISGATGSAYIIKAATAQDSGTYRVIVSTRYGTTPSNNAILVVQLKSNSGSRPSIIRNPSPVNVSLGDTVSFSVSASGTAPLLFQWQKNGTDIAGATDSLYTIDSVHSADWGTYTVIVSNGWGRDTSSGAALTIKNGGPASNPVAYWNHNPFRSSDGATFTFDIPDTAKVVAFVADMSGHMVYKLVSKNTIFNPGRYQVQWNGQNVAGTFAGAGAYIYVFTYTRMATGKTIVIRKPVFLVK